MVIREILREPWIGFPVGSILALVSAGVACCIGKWACGYHDARQARKRARKVYEIRQRLEAADGDGRWSA